MFKAWLACWSKDIQNIGLAKRLLGYCFWLLGSGLTAASDDIIKAACQYVWYKSTPMSLWHSDLKIHLFGFGLLGSSIMVARVWQGSVSGGTWLVVCCPESKTPSPMSVQHCDLKISIWAFYNGSLWDQLLGCSKWLLGCGLTASQWSRESDWLSE